MCILPKIKERTFSAFTQHRPETACKEKERSNCKVSNDAQTSLAHDILYISSGSCDDHEPPVIPLKMVKPFTDKEIGRGAYGRIFEVEYSKIQCAAKEVHEIMLNVEDKQALLSIKRIFLKECHIWSHLQHPCIVQFIGLFMQSCQLVSYIYSWLAAASKCTEIIT